jgi:hypothetical protein
MGTAANGFCHATAEDAAAHACGTLYPLANVGVAGDGSVVSAVVQCSGATGTTLNLLVSRNGGPDVGESLAFSGAPCDELAWLTYTPFSLTAEQGAILGAAVAAVWGIGWCWKAFRRTLDSGPESANE